MTPAQRDHTDREHAVDVGAGRPRVDSPRATAKPTGDKQADENVDNEPVG